MFDLVAVMGLDIELARLYDSGDFAGAADLSYLAEMGRVDAAPSTSSELGSAIRRDLDAKLRSLEEDPPSEWPTGDGSPQDLLMEAAFLASSGGHPSSIFFNAGLPRGGELLVAFYRRLMGDHAVGVLDRELRQTEWRHLSKNVVVPKSLRGIDPKAAVVEIVARVLPEPSADTPIEAVLDFVDDPEVRAKADRLRLWMRKAADPSVPLRDVELELETMLHEFRRHMALHKLKTHDGLLRTVLALPLGVAEELMHLRPKAAIDAMFVVRERRATRIEVELTAPGHEVAYIDAARQRFGPGAP